MINRSRRKQDKGLDKSGNVEMEKGGDKNKEAVDEIIARAIMAGASDIHFESLARDKHRMRMRIDGALDAGVPVRAEDFPMLMGRIKVMAHLGVGDRRNHLEGIFRWRQGTQGYDVRVSQIPTRFGERIVLRILYGERALIPLTKLGMSESDQIRLERLTAYQNGLVLCAGPTGSGKTTTLYALLNQIDRCQANIITIEDPPEITLSNISQLAVDHHYGLDFEHALRAVLRQDPDVIMVGEIRDEETARTAVQAAITGHLVLSSIHAGGVVSAVLRLRDMGVEEYALAAALKGVVAQRLVKKLCPNCRRTEMAGPLRGKILGVAADYPLAVPVGCEACGGRGYRGRIGVFEVLTTDTRWARELNLSEWADGPEKALKEMGVTPLKEQLLALVRAKTIDFREAMGAINYGHN